MTWVVSMIQYIWIPVGVRATGPRKLAVTSLRARYCGVATFTHNHLELDVYYSIPCLSSVLWRIWNILKLPTHLHIWSASFNRLILYRPNRSNIRQCVGCYPSNLAYRIAHFDLPSCWNSLPASRYCVAGSGGDVTDTGDDRFMDTDFITYTIYWNV